MNNESAAEIAELRSTDWIALIDNINKADQELKNVDFSEFFTTLVSAMPPVPPLVVSSVQSDYYIF